MFPNDFNIFYYVSDEDEIRDLREVFNNIIDPCFDIYGKGNIIIKKEYSDIVLSFENFEIKEGFCF